MNIEDLISQYIDGTLSSDAEAELHHRLAVSPESRRLFRAHIMLRGVARDQRVLHTPAPDVRAKLFDRLAREEGMAAMPVPPVASQAAKVGAPVPSPAMARQERPERRRRRALPWLIPTMIASALLVFLWSTGRFGVPSSGPQLADGGGTAGTPQREVLEDKPVSSPESGLKSAGSAPSGAAPVVSSAAPVERKGSGLMADAALETQSRSLAPATVSARVARSKASRHQAADGMIAAVTPQEGQDDRMMEESQMMAPPPPPPPPALASRQKFEGDGARDTESSSKSFAFSDADASNPPVLQSLSVRSDEGTHSAPDAVALNASPTESPSDMAAVLTPPPETAQEKAPSLLDEVMDALRKKNPSTLGMGVMPRRNPLSAPAGGIAPTAVVLPRELEQMILGSDSAAEVADHTAPSVSAFAMEQPGPGPVTLTIGLQQHSLMSFSGSDVHLQVLLKAGVELGGGDHQVYGVVSGRNYRETSSDSLIGAVYNGDFYPGSLIQPNSPSQKRESIEDERNELWVGGGYRYSHEIAKGWRVGIGLWSGAGARYIRVGSELPVAYQPVRWMRVEILPTIQYTTAHGQRSVTTFNEAELRAGYVEQNQRTTVLENDRELNFGIGIGAALLW